MAPQLLYAGEYQFLSESWNKRLPEFVVRMVETMRALERKVEREIFFKGSKRWSQDNVLAQTNSIGFCEHSNSFECLRCSPNFVVGGVITCWFAGDNTSSYAILSGYCVPRVRGNCDHVIGC